MTIRPELEEVKAIAARGQYKVLPVSCELLSDLCTPIQALRILKNISTHCYLLESAQQNEKWGRYTFLGYDPKLEITCMDGELRAGNLRMHTDDPSAVLRQILADYRSPRLDYLPPFTGGLVGYFSYDYLGYSEPAVRTRVEDGEAFKDVDLMLFDKVIAFDNFRQKIILIANMSLEDPETGYNKAVLELEQMARLLRCGEMKQEPPGKLTGEVAALSTKSARAETTDEIAGCAAAMRSHATKVETDMDLLEIVGTGGDGAHSFNISTTSALVCAAGGGRHFRSHRAEVVSGQRRVPAGNRRSGVRPLSAEGLHRG